MSSSCAGRLVADRNGIRYVTTHKDALTITHTDLERFEVDSAKQRLRIKPRGGRSYHFTHPADDALLLFVFLADAERVRTRLVAQDQ